MDVLTVRWPVKVAFAAQVNQVSPFYYPMCRLDKHDEVISSPRSTVTALTADLAKLKDKMPIGYANIAANCLPSQSTSSLPSSTPLYQSSKHGPQRKVTFDSVANKQERKLNLIVYGQD